MIRLALASPVRLALCAGVLLGIANGEEPEAIKFFETSVRPLLAAECYDCHGPDKNKGGLRLDHIDWITKGGDTGPAIVAGKPDESLLVEAIRRDDPDFAMPPKTELSAADVEILEKWVALGAPWPKEAATGQDDLPIDEHGFTQADHDWWAKQPVTDPAVPEAGEKWNRNAIDAFVIRKLTEAKLKPAPEAPKEELVRRAYFDLHGLPPTPEQITAFVDDPAPDAWERLIDRLLEDPRYGERWAQHWLDVVRYADSDGYRADGYRPDVWRYRDYVIDAFNDDKPYDQFVREQIAADEFAADDPDTVIATAFLRHGVYEWNQRDARGQWDIIMTEMTNVTGETFLGLGVGCAQCHDHKFDPILQKDYFALQSFFNSTWWPEHDVLATPEQQADYDSKLAIWEKETAEIRAELDALQAPTIEGKRAAAVKMFPEDIKAIYAKPSEERNAYEKQLISLVQRQVDHDYRRIDWKKTFAKKPEELARYETLTAKLAEFDKLKPAALPTAFITTDIGTEPATTFIEKRGEQVPVEPAFLTLLDLPVPEIKPTESTTGRRTALAEWIADEANPFSTRVIVNRLWQRHFGVGLVATANDFGMLGAPPTHPELLDWLTTRFLDGDWQMKPIHRLIMNSATYRQTSRLEPGSEERIADPTNRLLWRFPPQRLDAEQLRDGMLATSGELQQRDGGSAVDGTSPHRSVFVKKRRNSPDEVLRTFDAPSGFGSASERIATTTPTQSLLLLNGKWSVTRAAAFAKRVLGSRQNIGPEEIASAYQMAYGRSPSESESAAALAFIQSQTGAVKAPEPTSKDPYAGETGLRPIAQKFVGVEGYDLGEKSLWLQPGSQFEQLDFTSVKLPEDSFTIEAITVLEAIYKDASVNTLISRWNGSHGNTGWALGATSASSGYGPRNLITQLTGDDFQGQRIYEVVASDLRVPDSKPAYLAAVISAEPSADDQTKGTVTFYVKDLSDPKAKLQIATVPHQIVGGLKSRDSIKALIGSRNGAGHRWDGQLARLVISDGALEESQLLVNGAKAKEATRVIDWDFSGSGSEPAPNTAWVPQKAKSAPSSPPTKELAAMTDFCHVLLSSNEFLYLH